MPIRILSNLKKFLPLATEPEAEKAFATYRNYLVHIERLLGRRVRRRHFVRA
ncbi:MAG: hypothetical protein ACRDGP_01185 [Actinomycetota bacterium]